MTDNQARELDDLALEAGILDAVRRKRGTAMQIAREVFDVYRPSRGSLGRVTQALIGLERRNLVKRLAANAPAKTYTWAPADPEQLHRKLAEIRERRTTASTYGDWHQVARDADLLQEALESALALEGVSDVVARFFEGEDA